MIILITGICGSLGRAFTDLLHEEHTLIGYDHHEASVASFRDDYSDVTVHLDDFTGWRYDVEPVDVVIHCAAYKHLPLGEENTNAFIDNNINKLNQLFSKAHVYGTDVIFISSDKAVEPCNLYGYTKAIGEHITKSYDGYIARCGNFLGSTGSVIPLWEKCIAEGKPLPITDMRMKRYVIDVSDAAKQIWAGYKKNEKLIIPQCEEITISELYTEVIHRHGKDSYPTTVVGKRPGEKLQEKLRWDHESV